MEWWGDERIYDVHVSTDEQSDDAEAEEAGCANGRPDGDVGVVSPRLCCVSRKVVRALYPRTAYHPEQTCIASVRGHQEAKQRIVAY